MDGSGNMLRYYNYYPGGLSNLHSLRVGSSAYLYVKDVTGNVLGMLNSSGNKINDYEYSAFGELVDVNETVPNRFRFASGELDRLGLYYFRARYYQPELMRFLSEDPIGLAGGINQYVYAGNNPVDNVDLTGLECETKVIDGETYTVGPDGLACADIEGLDVIYDPNKASGVSRYFFSRGPSTIGVTLGSPGFGSNPGDISLARQLEYSLVRNGGCIGAVGELAARAGFDVALLYAYSSGAALVARGVAMYVPGIAYSSGLILTRTATAFGQSPVAWGQRMMGMSMINQGSASMATIAGPSWSKVPGGNIYSFLNGDAFAACGG